MKSDTRVRLRSFNGTSTPTTNVPAAENYWRLIGRLGQIVDSPEERPHFAMTGPDARVCVRFDDDLKEMGLEAHNRIPNSLWIREADLSQRDTDDPSKHLGICLLPSMPTRPCRFCLSIQDASVFADFDADDQGRIFLRRISFDGYGCCDLDRTIRTMSDDDSRAITEAVTRGTVETEKIEALLLGYFTQNQDVIWRDALAEHGLSG